MKKCPKCGYKEKAIEPVSFEALMNETIKRVSVKQMKEYGYGIPEKNNQKRSKKARKK
tara:strand:+ start:1148 stop:1321 length:174 start_codon:yes stop_codon:yes gene_type:complete